ncbi:hypothetical protein [Nonlabens ulvanivorans]|uniref:Uncharacterized protein n=1 Tax=Nonlabens ulvanivorans TaxID=906888 RepID=A0A084JYI0_NONUL|nr:hypothetical protein [Nonlabens ulvanivorans]KEZ94014.1 hypothetical protein IL45_02385 [Nonlabens ulvanivorans]PRX11036.1 hypothetical protein LY02_02876 [Nonlabens ulvanivorans]
MNSSINLFSLPMLLLIFIGITDLSMNAKYLPEQPQDEFCVILDDLTFVNIDKYKEVDYDFIKSITTDQFDKINLAFEKPSFAQFHLLSDDIKIKESLRGYLVLIKFPIGSSQYKTHNKVNLILTDEKGLFLNQQTVYQDYDLNGSFIGLTSRILNNQIQTAKLSNNTYSYYKIDQEGFFNETEPFESFTVKNRSYINHIDSSFLNKHDLILFPSIFITSDENKLRSLRVYKNNRLDFESSYFLTRKEFDYYESFFVINKLKSSVDTVFELVEIKYLLSNHNWIGTNNLDYQDIKGDFTMNY